MKKTALSIAALLTLAGLARAADPVVSKEILGKDKSTVKGGTLLFLGANATDGNSETTVLNAELLKDGVCPFGNDYTIGASYNYGEAAGDKNVENAKAVAALRRMINDPLYGYVKADALNDDIAGIDYRITVGPGLGTYLVKNDQRELGLEAGATWVKEKTTSEEVHMHEDGVTEVHTTTTEDDYFALRVADTFKQTLSPTSRAWQTAEWLPEFSDFSNYLLNAEVGIEADITAGISLRVLAKDTYDSEPAAGREKNDLSVIAGLGVRL